MKKMRKRKLKRGYKQSIVTGFFALYLMCMLLSTYLMKRNCETILSAEAGDVMEQMINQLQKMPVSYDKDGNLSEETINLMRYFLFIPNATSNYSMLNAGIIDPNGVLIAETGEAAYSGMPYYSTDSVDSVNKELEFDMIDLFDFFTPEEIDLFRSYYEEANSEEMKSAGKSYNCMIYYDNKQQELVRLQIKESEEKVTDRTYQVVDKKMVYSWHNDAYPPIKNFDIPYSQSGGDITMQMYFPYLHLGRDSYESWKRDEFLHDFSRKQVSIDEYNDKYSEENLLKEYIKYRIFGKDTFQWNNHLTLSDYKKTEADYILTIHQKTNTWLMAVQKMKYIYIYGLVLMAVCMAKVLHSTGKTYKMQQELEETRRDFTNAMAHELKTPLSVIRSLAENMEEETSEEMRSYYTSQMIHQTEVMDDMVKEMIFLSKMDSDKLMLKSEPMNVQDIVKEQIKKLDYFIEEKNIKVQYLEEEDFIINGDKMYLEKAILNLLENAVYYNKKDGSVVVTMGSKFCTIENTGNPIAEEDLPHVCDMFFTGNKSRTSDEKHMGLGLYLAKRIFERHEMEFTIENTDVGVKVTMKK